MDNKIEILLKEIQIKLDALEDKLLDLQEIKNELERELEKNNGTL